MYNDVLSTRLNLVIQLHNKMNNSYFFQSPSTANLRRKYENENSMSTIFSFEGNDYNIVQLTKATCKHIYYSLTVFVNGEETAYTIRYVNKLLKQIQSNQLNFVS